MYISYCFNSNVPDPLDDTQNNEPMTFGCMWLVPRGPNIIEFSIIGKY